MLTCPFFAVVVTSALRVGTVPARPARFFGAVGETTFVDTPNTTSGGRVFTVPMRLVTCT